MKRVRNIIFFPILLLLVTVTAWNAYPLDWPTFPAAGSANFEENARQAFQDQSDNGAALEAEIADARKGETTLEDEIDVLQGAIDDVEAGTGIADGSVAEAKLDVNNAPEDLKIMSWNASAGKMEWTTQGSATDTGEVRMNAGDPADYLDQKIDDDTIKANGSDQLYVNLPHFETAHTSNGALTTAMLNGRKTHSNYGASGSVDLDLPACASDLIGYFIVKAGYTFSLTPDGTDIFRYLTDESSATDVLSSSTIGRAFKIIGSDNGTWHILELNGPVSYTSGAFDPNKLSRDTDPTLGAELDCGSHSVGFGLADYTGDGTTTVDWRNGNLQNFTFGTQDETFTFTAPTNPATLTLIITQDATGGRSATFPTVKWLYGTAPDFSGMGANEIAVVQFIYDGSQYLGSYGIGFETP